MISICNPPRQLMTLLFVVLALGSNTSAASTARCPDNAASPFNGCSLPGMFAGNFPHFDNAASVNHATSKDGLFNLRAKVLKGSADNRLGSDDETRYFIDEPKHGFRAGVNARGASGRKKISTRIDAEEFSISAGRKDTWSAPAGGMRWGFNTNDIACSRWINALLDHNGCTSEKVAHLNRVGATGRDRGFGKNRAADCAPTSVPVPAAGWLLGSGLIGLAGMTRRRRNA